jgi:hypothetical protein
VEKQTGCLTTRRGTPMSLHTGPVRGNAAILKRVAAQLLFLDPVAGWSWDQDRAGAGRRVRALKAMVSRQQAIMVPKTPDQPQRSAIQPTPVPAMAEPKT